MAVDTHIPASLILWSMLDSQRREAVDSGIKAAAEAYYEDYTDADEIDPSFYRALEIIAEYGDTELDRLLSQVEAEITADTGGRRRFVGRVLEDDDAEWDDD